MGREVGLPRKLIPAPAKGNGLLQLTVSAGSPRVEPRSGLPAETVNRARYRQRSGGLHSREKTPGRLNNVTQVLPSPR